MIRLAIIEQDLSVRVGTQNWRFCSVRRSRLGIGSIPGGKAIMVFALDKAPDHAIIQALLSGPRFDPELRQRLVSLALEVHRWLTHL